ncbi:MULTISPECIES: site-specific integrase [unclassified Caballeronia]|uniref:tyrosine-type recombinase/integrase n=1 Tax=unclassified Caballeronia TaxID=2646786 RepID=UPI0028586D03|nr:MULTISPECIES: site-specific integrase [unclassified Caballeronia]MDR5771087.1 site-specific integrase [Caballeronia sp. LZ002]MDR5846524.1 site-specific integrase [Caballeronia sp. LZ003]
MSIRKRGGVYFIDIRTPDGARVRRSAGTGDRKEAQEYHDRLKSEFWRSQKLGERPAKTFEEAALRYLQQEAAKRDYANKVRHIRHFRERFSGRRIDSITAAEIMDALPQVLYRGDGKTPSSTATRNRYLATIRGMLNDAATRWEWIDKAPKFRQMREVNRRVRWISREDAQRLLASFSKDWLRDVTAFGFSTGLRQGNITGLEWSQVDLVRRRAWIHPDQAKAGKPIGVPLNSEAIEVIRRQIGNHTRFVFTRNNKQIVSWDREQWLFACKRAGIENFRFHDVRHTWASWHVQNGTPLERLKQMGGWSDYSMVLRYAHLAPDHLVEHAESVTIWAQSTADSKAQEELETLRGG